MGRESFLVCGEAVLGWMDFLSSLSPVSFSSFFPGETESFPSPVDFFPWLGEGVEKVDSGRKVVFGRLGSQSLSILLFFFPLPCC